MSVTIVEELFVENLGSVSEKIYRLLNRQLVETAELKGFKVVGIPLKDGGGIYQRQVMINGYKCLLYSAAEAYFNRKPPHTPYAQIAMHARMVIEVDFILINIKVENYDSMELVIPANKIREWPMRGESRPWVEVYPERQGYIPLIGYSPTSSIAPSFNFLHYVDRWDLLEKEKK